MIKNGQKLYSVFDSFEEDNEEFDEFPLISDEEEKSTEVIKICANCDHFTTENESRLYGTFVFDSNSGWCCRDTHSVKIVKHDHMCEVWSGEGQNILNNRQW